MAYIVIALYSYGLYSYGLYSYGLYRHGLGLYSCGLYRTVGYPHYFTARLVMAIAV